MSLENSDFFPKKLVSKNSHINDYNIDPYSDKEIELQFLNSKPSCFLFMGKPGSGCSTLAQLFIDEFQCEYVNGKDLIEQHLESQTEIGKKIRTVLEEGGMIDDGMTIDLIRDKIASPEVAHRGYLLDGFPNANCSNVDIVEQFNLLKSFKMAPDFIVYLKIPDVDLKGRLVSQRIDPQTGDIYFKQNYDPDFPPPIEVPPQVIVKKEKTGDEEEEEEEEAEEEILEEGETALKGNPDFPLLDQETIKRLLKRQEDIPEQVEVKISNYTEKAANVINDYLDNFNGLNVITLNANLPPANLFKQLMERLRYYNVRPAAIPIELYHVASEDEEEETPDGSDIDELFRELSSKNCPAPGFRWQKSEWMNYCPVALHEGTLLPGQPQFSVGFLNKVYVLSTKERMKQFLQNPRPYLLPPQPQIPCKIAIVGPKESGKSTLAHLLANKYNATVVDMKLIMKPHEEEAKRIFLEETLVKSKKESIEVVKAKIRKQMEIERADQLANAALEKLGEEAIDGIEDNTRERIINEEVEDEELLEKPPLLSEDTIQGPPSIEEEIVKDLPEKLPEIFVDEFHPEVQELVAKAMAEAEKQEMILPLELYMEELEKTIKANDEALRNREPNSKLHGCWILDNYPNRRDQWTGMMESNPESFLIPDQILVLKDSTENYQFMLKRWYKNNKEAVDSAIALRVGDKIKESGTAKPDQEVVMTTDDDLPPPGPELNGARKEISDWFQEWAGASNIASSAPTHVETIELNIEDKSVEQLFQNTVQEIEKIFKPVAIEVSGADLEEDEEDEGAGDEENEEEEQEEEGVSNEEEPNRSKKKPLGDTNYWCPVALKTNNILWPGNPEIAAKYLGKIYYFANEENREKFIEEPLNYIPVQNIPKTPALRLFLLGAKGSGKTTHGRILAQKLGLFHISFHEILQEYILPKNRKKIGPEFKEEEDIPDFIMPDPILEEAEKQGQDSEDVGDKSTDIENPEEIVNENDVPDEKLLNEMKEEMEEWDENENAIKENLENQQPLSTALLLQILQDFWNKDPFENKGFILEGFPRNAEEAQFLTENNMYADGVISLLTTEDDIIARLLPPRLQKWKDRRDKKDLYKRKLAEYKAKKKQLKMDRRRKELLAELEEKRNKRYNKEKVKKTDSEDENEEEEEEEEEEDLEEEVNIDDMLAEEFEEEEEPEDEEEEDTEEAAIEQIENEIREIYDNDTNEITSVMESFTEVQVPRFEIEAGEKPTIVQYRISKKLKKLLDRRESIFERCYPVSPGNAEKLIKAGHKFLSRFGRWCPVTLLNENYPFMPLVDQLHPTYPVIYRNYIYFTKSKQARELFMMNPLHYLKQPSPKHSVPIKLCLLGLPKSGKTTLAQRFVREYGITRITGGNVLRRVLNENWNTELAKEIKNFLVKGLIVPHEYVVKCMELCLMDSECAARGYVLDGYPFSFEQIQLMHESNIIPSRIFELISSPRELILRANKDRKAIELPFPMHDSLKVIAIKMANYSENINDIRNCYGTEHDNIRSIDAEKGTWYIWEKVNEDVKQQICHIQNYLHNRNEEKAANIYNLCIRPIEFNSRLSNLREYCPVSLSMKGQLVRLDQDYNLQYAAEYKGYYYKMKGQEELEIFHNCAEEILKSATLPEQLPNKIDPEKIQDMFPMQLDLQGYCPVCFLDGKCRYEGLILGNKEKYVAEYREKLFTFCSDACFNRFMRSPLKYWGLELPKKLPPVKNPLNIKSLPLPGYLEQTMADALRNALTATGTLKPKYPFIDPSRSALLYIALHLKAFNPKSAEHLRKKYKHKLEEFEDSCELIKYLSEHMTLKYKEVEHRPVGFDKKMSEFLRLKALEDNEERWIN